MNLIQFLFKVAKNVSDVDADEINRLQLKAENSVSDASTDHKGWKGIYAKLHKGWLFQLILMLFVSVVIALFQRWLNNLYNPQKTEVEDIEYDEDEDE